MEHCLRHFDLSSTSEKILDNICNKSENDAYNYLKTTLGNQIDRPMLSKRSSNFKNKNHSEELTDVSRSNTSMEHDLIYLMNENLALNCSSKLRFVYIFFILN